MNPELTIYFEDRRVEPAEQVTFHEENGIIGFVEDLNKKKEQIQELFAKHNIEYKIKVKEILQKNPIDSAIIGTLGLNRSKNHVFLLCEKEDLLVVRELLKIL